MSTDAIVGLAVAVFSVVASALGYLATAFVFKPILRYRAIKFKIVSDLTVYANVPLKNDAPPDHPMNAKWWARVEALRRHSADLRACLMELPGWYLRILARRNEHPTEAVPELIGLSNTTDYERYGSRIAKIRECLRLHTLDL